MQPCWYYNYWTEIHLLLGFALGLVLMTGLFYLMKYLKDIKSTEEKEDSEIYSKLNSIEERLNHSNPINNLEKKLDYIIQLTQDNLKLVELKPQQAESKFDSEEEDKITDDAQGEISRIKSTNNYYCTIPNAEGSFAHTQDDYVKGTTYYRIEVDINNPNSGYLFYVSNPRDKKAINRSRSFLEPVCEIENKELNKRQQFTRIKCIEPGRVERIDNKWRVSSKDKVKLRFV